MQLAPPTPSGNTLRLTESTGALCESVEYKASALIYQSIIITNQNRAPRAVCRDVYVTFRTDSLRPRVRPAREMRECLSCGAQGWTCLVPWAAKYPPMIPRWKRCSDGASSRRGVLSGCRPGGDTRVEPSAGLNFAARVRAEDVELDRRSSGRPINKTITLNSQLIREKPDPEPEVKS